MSKYMKKSYGNTTRASIKGNILFGQKMAMLKMFLKKLAFLFLDETDKNAIIEK